METLGQIAPDYRLTADDRQSLVGVAIVVLAFLLGAYAISATGVDSSAESAVGSSL